MGTIDQALTDVKEAQSLGLDAFALNVQQPDEWWTRASLDFLFEASSQTNFKLFFSMDMAVIPSPSDCAPVLKKYITHPAYYHVNNRPFLSTFRGGAQSNANQQWNSVFESLPAGAKNPFFVPNFEDHSSVSSDGVYPDSIFATFPSLDGVMSWETAWPRSGESASAINGTLDIDATNLAMTRDAIKAYMLPLSTFQAKHHPEHGNWFRIGGLNLPRRLIGALDMQPEFVELLTWNDAGEGHYFGNLWPESMPDPVMAEMVQGWGHKAWMVVLRPFVAALKGGAGGAAGVLPEGRFEGAFWYRPLLKGAECWGDKLGLGTPGGLEAADDAVNVVVMLGKESEGVKIRVLSGGSVVDEFDGKVGMNMHQVDVKKGEQVVQLVAGDGKVIAEGRGKKSVTDQMQDVGGICNFNYQVVKIE
ncbi:glycoside hydrolase [Chaetomium fimeti]|uniref:Glycoside hydrolase n=1 Tax=Chaetomium fimeti TaxID=1854472 RepID=A0AAE0HN18_9PEZI|nr:glycoside hydrolase [Chaetomium fimeti]